MSQTIDRHGNLHQGKGADGGQFAEKRNSKPKGGLAASDERNVTRVRTPIAWTESGVLPTPRHRKPQNIRRVFEAELSLKSVAGDDAPDAFTVTIRDWRYEGDDGDAALVDTQRVYRVVDGELFIPLTRVAAVRRNPESVIATPQEIVRLASGTSGRDIPNGGFARDEAHALAEVQSRLEEFVAIDGMVWRKTREPVYEIGTHGMGANHGSTYIHVNDAPVADGVNTAHEDLFPADQYDEAVSAALEAARRRGDSGSFESIKQTRPILVTGSFEAGSTWQPAPQIEYLRPYQVRAVGGDMDQAFESFRRQLMTVPGAVIEVDDGWGGVGRAIDPSKLSRSQEQDYLEFLRETESRRLLR